MQSTFRQRLLASTLLFGTAAFATPAWAQPTDDDLQETGVQATPDPTGGELMQNQDDNAEEQGAIIVTGSRIQRRDLTSTSPLAVVQDEEFKLSGAVNVEQVINTLPQVIPGATSFSNNPGGGVATLNLRGLGSARTLVLVNGRRWMFYDTSQIVDLNTIPQFLIDSVDVVTGGASAVYGSDALAGVVNFRLQTDLQGLTAGTQYSITEEGDGARWNAYMAVGSEFADGRGNVVAFGEYFKRKPIFQSGREFSRFALGDDGEGGLTPLGSSLIPGGRFLGPATVAVPGVNLNACPSPPAAQPPGCDADFTDPGEVSPFGLDLNGDGDFTDAGETAPLTRTGGTNFQGAGALFGVPGQRSNPFSFATDTYNYAPSNFLQVPQERFLLGGYGEFEISDAITAFTEVTFVNNRVENELAPTPAGINLNFGLEANRDFLSAEDFAELQQIDANEEVINAANIARCNAVNAADPDAGCTPNLLPGLGVVNLTLARRFQETGPRNSFDERNAFRVLAGVKGPITDTFNYEASYFYARTRNANIQEGNISRSALTNAALTGSVNLFGVGSITPDTIDELLILAQNNEISTLQVAQASVAGTLFNFGLGADDIGIAAGVEYRSVGSQFIPDTALSSGDVLGFNAGDATEGSYNVKEVFGELRLPIISDRPFFERLTVTAAGRYSDYSLEAVGGVASYSVGAEYAPVRDLTFRAQYQRAIRAPNVGELFSGQAVGFPLATDPCALASALTDPTVRNLCIQSGVPASAIGTGTLLQPDQQIQSTFGGNPNLQEEKSDSYTAGVVLRPRFIPRLNVTVDYFNITIEDAIASAGGGANNILDLCFNVIQNINSPICQAINRDPNTGIIRDPFFINVSTANIAELKVEGVDFQVDYSMPLRFSVMGGEESKVNFFFLGTYTRESSFKAIADLPEVTECADKFGQTCGQPTPAYKWTSRLSLIDGPLTASLRWRHLSSTEDDDPETDFSVERIGGYDLFDLSFAFDASDALRFTIGVNNLLDEEPPIIGDNQEQANTFPGTFDPLGRDYFVSASVRF